MIAQVIRASPCWRALKRCGFPALPHCGNIATGGIAVQKVFLQALADDSVTGYVVHQRDVPYCDECKALHDR